MKRHPGFTLVELAIVLVIIGLVVGGVLVGRDLIATATVNAQLSQVNKLNAAINTFRVKYGGLPGDLLYSKAAQFGLYWMPSGGATAWGDGNGIVHSNIAYPNCLSGEASVFFMHLAQSKMIPGAYGFGGGTTTIAGATATGGSGSANNLNDSTTISDILPPGTMANTSFFPGTDGVNNYLALTTIVSIRGSGYTDFASRNTITPLQASAMDGKIDDGVPDTGKVFALGSSNPVGNCTYASMTTAATNSCVNSGKYNTAGASADVGNCSLRFSFQ